MLASSRLIVKVTDSPECTQLENGSLEMPLLGLAPEGPHDLLSLGGLGTERPPECVLALCGLTEV